MKGQKLTEGSQGSGERDEGWRLMRGPLRGWFWAGGSSQGQVLGSHRVEHLGQGLVLVGLLMLEESVQPVRLDNAL